MSCHLTGNSCHVYGRAYIRTQLEAEPQYPSKRKQDLDNYISQIDVMLLMLFSNFYKQRILPTEIYDFFVNNRTEVRDIYIDTELDYLKILQEDIDNARTRADKPMIHFADQDESKSDDDLYGKIKRLSQKNPVLRMYEDYIAAYMQ